MRLGLVVGVLGVLGGPCVGLAQSPVDCGDLPEMPGDADEYRGVFTDPEDAWLREANGFETLPHGVAVSRLSDERECHRVAMALREHLRTTVGRTEEGRQALRDGYRFSIYRVGPYYVVPVQPTDETGSVEEGYEMVNVFRASTLEFVGDYLG